MEESFATMFEESMSDLVEKKIINSTVIRVTDTKVIVDIKYKSEGEININEFAHIPSVGDQVKVMIVKLESSTGQVVLSKKQAEMIKTKELLEDIENNNISLEGKINKIIKGGFYASIGGMNAFVPLSHIDIYQENFNPENYLNKTMFFKVLKYDEAQNNLIVSHRDYVIEKIQLEREKFLEALKVGDSIEGVIHKIYPNKVIIKINDGVAYGFVLARDISWLHISSPNSILSEGEVVKSKIIFIDPSKNQLRLSIKHISEDPWVYFKDNYNVGDIVEGNVTGITNFGAFVTLSDGIEGLIHIHEMSWSKKVAHPKEIFSEGDFVKVKIININVEDRKISLSLKQVLDNPWSTIEKDYPIGLKTSGVVQNIEEFGVFIKLDNGIVGLLHKNDVDWNFIVKHKYNSMFNKGDSIEVKILDVNVNNHTVSLGLKQLHDNPYSFFGDIYPIGSTLEVVVIKISASGLVVKISFSCNDTKYDIEGFIPSSEINIPHDKKIFDVYSLDDKINVVVKNIVVDKSKLIFSIKMFYKKEQQAEISNYTSVTRKSDNGSASLGSLIDLSKINIDNKS